MQLDSIYCLILSKSLHFLRFSLFLQMQNSTCLIGLLCSFKLSVCLQCGRPGFDSWVGKIPWRRKWHPTSALLPGKSHGWRSLIGYSPWGRKESDKTERLHFTGIHGVYQKTNNCQLFFSLLFEWAVCFTQKQQT